MGNHLACVYAVDSPVVKIADLDGNLHEYGHSQTVAELMIEFPGRLVMPADQLRRDRRVRGMKADTATKIGLLYALFPMDRSNSRISDEEIAKLLSSQLPAGRKASSSAKVFPANIVKSRDEIVVAPKIKLENTVSPAMGPPAMRPQNRRRWQPELQSINELKCIA